MTHHIETIAFFVYAVLSLFACSAAWRNGVRDGYHNPHLPHVRSVLKGGK